MLVWGSVRWSWEGQTFLRVQLPKFEALSQSQNCDSCFENPFVCISAEAPAGTPAECPRFGYFAPLASTGIDLQAAMGKLMVEVQLT